MAIFKKVAFIVLVGVSVIFLYLSYDLERKSPSPVPLLPVPSAVLPTPSVTPVPALRLGSSIFVPYWALGKSGMGSISYDTLYYFGVTADANGLATDDTGYRAMNQAACPKSKNCILVLRLLEDGVTKDILQKRALQQQISRDISVLAERYGYSGVALDLEISGLIKDNIKGQINDFVEILSSSLKKNYKTLSVIVYGDAYFRDRPFDMKFIGEHSDEVMVMAYDFHKAYGEPGPNFPFEDRARWGYDFKSMINDFSTDVARKKLTIILGMYGYDWTLNAQGSPLKRAEALSLNHIQSLLKGFASVKINTLPSGEKAVEYTDSAGDHHIIWYEDQDSSSVKEEYMKTQGIEKVSFWSYGYF